MIYRSAIKDDEERHLIRELLSRGWTSWEIAQDVGVSPRAIRAEHDAMRAERSAPDATNRHQPTGVIR